LALGAYARGSDLRVDRAIQALPAIERFLMQRSDEIESFEGTRSALLRFGTGHS
jgi:flagellar biosynthesis/type III secretory pathway ATPase